MMVISLEPFHVHLYPTKKSLKNRTSIMLPSATMVAKVMPYVSVANFIKGATTAES